MRGIAVIAMFLVLASSASAILIEHWGVYEDELYNEFVSNSVNIDTEEMQNDDNIKVVFSVPELGIRESGGYYSGEIRHASIQNTIWLPYDAESGEYVLRMTVTDSEGNKHVKHRFIEIE
jgi:hypothetical protein